MKKAKSKSSPRRVRANRRNSKLAGGRGGRPRGSRYASGLQTASWRMGLDVMWLKIYRTMGCEAFKSSGRIDLRELQEWMHQNSSLLLETVKKFYGKE